MSPRNHSLALVAVAFTLDAACSPPAYVEPRQPCAQIDPDRTVFFGDLHVHTSYSFDANAFEVRNTPFDAWRFARGAALPLASGAMVQLDRPLDFAAVTDHSEFLGEVEACTTPGSPGYDSATCANFRRGGNDAVVPWGVRYTNPVSTRFPDVPASDAAGAVWSRIQQAAAEAYDTSSACSFTAFVAYEYTAATAFSTLHRNVIFANDRVPAPTSYFEQPTPQGLWQELRATCLDAGTGCDVLAIPHNSNESNGNMFFVEYPGATSPADEQQQARERAALEPLVEVYQHKAASECMNGLSGVLGAADEQCAFEAPRRDPITDCGDTPGAGGASRLGCFSRLDFVRDVLLEGLAESRRIGVNPYRLGLVASTDTHNGTPGFTGEASWLGHRGTDDDTAQKRLGTGGLTPGGVEFSPGGLTGVWAEENSRPSLFAALRRREVFGTSGPRLSVRLFAGWSLPDDLCSDPQLVPHAYAGGVPMGGVLPARPSEAGAPVLVVAALRDPGTPSHPSLPLQRIQIVKGWLAADGQHQQVFEVAGDPDNGAGVDLATCTPTGAGADSLCGVFRDPAFDPAQPAFYYARVLENPSCRWSTFTCNALAPDERPPSCTDPNEPRTIQERAWTSPIWYDPK